MLSAGLAPHGYRQKRRVEGKLEYYDDEWGNLWRRMIDGPVKGEIHKPAIEDWRQLDSLRPPDYSHPDCAAHMTALFRQPTDKFKLAQIGGWIFDNARYLRKMEAYFADMGLFPDELMRMHNLVAGVYERKIHLAGNEMIEALRRRPDLVAVLDVTHPEPPAAHSPLYTLPNVVLTPHIAGAPVAEAMRMRQFAVAEVERFVNGQPPRWALRREQIARMG